MSKFEEDQNSRHTALHLAIQIGGTAAAVITNANLFLDFLAGADEQNVEAPPADKPKRGRPAKADVEPTLQERMQEVADKEKGNAAAGAGEPVEQIETVQVDRQQVKTKMALVMNKDGEKMLELLRTHGSPADPAKPKFSEVPDEALAALKADADAFLEDSALD